MGGNPSRQGVQIGHPFLLTQNPFNFGCMEKEQDFSLEDPGSEISDRVKLFCNEYIINKFNGLAAAICAGYEEKSAAAQASRLLRNDNVKSYIAVLKRDLGLRLGITRERIAKEYAKLAFSDKRKLYNEDGTFKSIHELDDETAGAVSSFEIQESEDGKITTKRVRLHDKRAALGDLNKMLGYNEPEKFDITTGGEPINAIQIIQLPDNGRSLNNKAASGVPNESPKQ